MHRQRDPQGRFVKNPPWVEVGSSKTPVTSNPIIEELEEKQRTGQRLTLIERQTLLAWKEKQKQPSTSGKQKEIIKEKQLVFPYINQLIFEQPESLETTKPMAKEGHGSIIFTPEQRIEKREEEKKKRGGGKTRKW